MKDAQKPGHCSLTTLINWLREGRFVIPDFQREFAWGPADIRELMRSIFLDYYIGNLLLWKGKDNNFEALACEPIYGYPNDNGDRQQIVLDGQQRLTAIYYAFLAPDVPHPNRANRYLYYIRVDQFMDESYDDAFEYGWTDYWQILLLEDPEAQYAQQVFPISIIGKGDRGLGDWERGYEKHWADKAGAARAAGDEEAALEADRRTAVARTFVDRIRDIIHQYQVAYIELDRDLEISKICDIFTQVNSRGVRLDIFDLLNALLRPKEIKLKELWRKARKQIDLEFVGTDRMNIYLLQVMSILAQSYCSPKYLYNLLPGQEKKVRRPDGTLDSEILVPDKEDFERRWREAAAAVERAINQLRHPQEFGVVSAQYLPYASILPVFAALEAARQKLPADQQLNALHKQRHWYWASVFTQRYSSAAATTGARDYTEVKAWFDDDSKAPDLIEQFKRDFQHLDLHRETKRGTSIYNGVFNLLVLNGARDWTTGNAPQPDDLDDHHIISKKWGRENGLDDAIDTILNRTPLSAETNRNVIRERLPNQYLPELIDKSGRDKVYAVMESHFISAAAVDILLRDPFNGDHLNAFLDERKRAILEGIETLLVKERLSLSPSLRELDAKIEAVELTLRSTINEALDGDPMLLPSQVSQNIEERLQAAARKNAGIDGDHYETLAGKLEYADLRELEDTIKNKTLWPRFEERFGGKEKLAQRFGQLAELRNGIRHSRSVGEIARKEGEAALLWFEEAGRR